MDCFLITLKRYVLRLFRYHELSKPDESYELIPHVVVNNIVIPKLVIPRVRNDIVIPRLDFTKLPKKQIVN